MEQLQGFLAMGGYGAFVWPAFGLTALVMVWLLAASLRRLRGLERDLAEHNIAAPGGGRARRREAPDAEGEEAAS
ncbi:MAG: heme exporter protein CcmD [Kiloniellales bacterium]